jgi:hypothetical protein
MITLRRNHLESEHFVGQIAERLGWGLADAHELEDGAPTCDNAA